MKRILVLSLLFVSQLATSQENESKFEFRSFGIAPLGFYQNSGGSGGGPNMVVDVSYEYGKHIFSVSGAMGAEFTIFDRGDNFQEINLFYGREWSHKKLASLELHAGLGYFSFNDRRYTLTRIPRGRKATVGFPFLMKIKFRTGKKFCLGFRIEQNFNSISNITSIGILFQWNRLIKNK